MAVAPALEKKFEETKKMLRSVLLGEKEGVLHFKLRRLYEESVFEDIPFIKLGFPNLESMLSAMPDTVRASMNRDGEKVYMGVADQATAHIQKMVNKQKPKKSNKKGKFSRRGAPNRALVTRRPSFQRRPASYSSSGPSGWPGPMTAGAGMARVPPPYFLRPPSQQAPPSFTAMSANRYAPRHSRSSNKSPSPEDPRSKPRPYSGGGASNTSSNRRSDSSSSAPLYQSKPYRSVSHSDFKLQVHIDNSQQSTSPSAEVVKFGGKFDIPPRFHKLQEQGLLLEPEKKNVGSGDLRERLDKSHNTSLHKTVSNKESYRTDLNLYATSQGLSGGVQYHTTAVRGGFVSSLNIKGESFGSIDAFASRREAEAEAAKNACESLGIQRALIREKESPARSIADCTPQIKQRIKEIVSNRPNGLFSSRLPKEYEEKYKEKPPKELLSWALSMKDIVKMEPVADTDRKILYPVAAVKLTQTSRAQVVTIKPLAMPKPKIRFQGGVTFCVDPHHIYVQRSTSVKTIEKITEQLVQFYECRGAPKALVSGDVGEFCVAKYSVDNCWYRAVIRGRNEQTYTVFYVDFGNTEIVQHGQVRRILDNLAAEPSQVLRCALHNVHQISNHWSKEIDKELESLIDIPLVIHVLETHDNYCSVDIYLDEKQQHSFNDQLIRKGLASPYPVPQEPDTLILPDRKEWDVTVSFIRSTTDVTIRLVGQDYSEALATLEEQLSRCVSPLPRCIPGTMCVCQQTEEEGEEPQAHRGRIVAVNDNDDTADIYFADYGDKEDHVPRERLSQLPGKLNTLPYQAIPCKLSGLEPYSEEQEVIEEIVRLTFHKSLIAEVEERLERVSITLFDTTTPEDVNINSKAAEVLTTTQLKPKLPQLLTLKALNQVLSRLALLTSNYVHRRCRAQWVGMVDVGACDRTSQPLHATIHLPLRALYSLMHVVGSQKVGERVEGYVLTICPDTGHLYFVLQGPGLDKLEELQEEMTKIYGKGASAANLFVSHPKEQQLVAAPFDERWYRALIQEILPGRKVKVFYVDYGNVDVLPYSSLRNPAKEAKYMEKLPHQVIECRLEGFPPADFLDRLPEAAIDRLQELLPGEQMVHVELREHVEGELPVVDVFMEVEDSTEEEEESEDDEEAGGRDKASVVSVMDLLREERVFESEALEAIADSSEAREPIAALSDSIQECIPEDGDWALVSEAEESRLDSTLGEGDSTFNESKSTLDNSRLTENTVGDSSHLTDESVVLNRTPTVGGDTSNGDVNAEDGSGDATVPTSITDFLFQQFDDVTNRINAMMVTDTEESAAELSTIAAVSDSSHISAVSDTSQSAAVSDVSHNTEVSDSSYNVTASSVDSGYATNVTFSDPCPQLPTQDLPNSGDSVYVTWAEHPHNFRCIPIVSIESLQALMMEMQEFYNQQPEQHHQVHEVLRGHMYAGMYNDTWYRLQVRSALPGTDKVAVSFSDYGDCSIIESTALRHLAPQFRILPTQAIKAKLAGIVPQHGEWSDNCNNLFTELVLEKMFTAWILDTPDDLGYVTMTLVNPELQPNAFIHKILLIENFAQKLVT